MKTIILCYHKVGNEEDEGRWLCCSPDSLKKQVQYFKRKLVPNFLPQDFVSARPEGVCFTFDDAYISALSHAPEILESEGFRGAFYAVPSLVGQASIWDQEKQRPLADWETLRLAHKAGHEIGNHTWNHIKLASFDQVAQAMFIRMAQEDLVDHGFNPQSLCFPYGSYNQDTRDAMKEVGIKVGLKLGKRPVGNEPIHALPRIVVAYSDTIAHLLYKIYVRPKLP